MTTYRKLVRDRVPEILEAAGSTFEVETLNHDRYIIELKKKLQEELLEYEDAATPEEVIEEFADMLEVMHHLVHVHGVTMDEVEAIREQKREEHGGYDEKVFLIDVEE